MGDGQRAGANTSYLPALGGWFLPLLGRAPYNKAAVEASKTQAMRNVAYLEKALQTRTFLVSERVTLADIFVAAVGTRGFANVSCLLP